MPNKPTKRTTPAATPIKDMPLVPQMKPSAADAQVQAKPPAACKCLPLDYKRLAQLISDPEREWKLDEAWRQNLAVRRRLGLRLNQGFHEAIRPEGMSTKLFESLIAQLVTSGLAVATGLAAALGSFVVPADMDELTRAVNALATERVSGTSSGRAEKGTTKNTTCSEAVPV